MAFAQLYKITENVSKLHENADKFNADYSSPPLMTIGTVFLLLLGIIIDIAAIAIATFYLNKFIRTDQLPILLNILREESRKYPVLPSWKPVEPEPPQESKDPTSGAELSSETYQLNDWMPLSKYIKTTRRFHKSSFSSFPFNIQSSRVEQGSLKMTILTPSSTNCCNVRENEIQNSQLKTSRASRASSTNYQDSSIRSSVCNYKSRRSLHDCSFLQQQKAQLCAKKNVPDAIKLWLTESQEDDSTVLKTSNTRLSCSENTASKKPERNSLPPAGQKGDSFHPNTNLNSFNSKTIDQGCLDDFDSKDIKDPLGIERLNSHDKVRNYLCDLKAPRSAPTLPESSEEKTLKNCQIVGSNSEADLNESERTELNADRFSEFEIQSTSAGDTLSNRKVNCRQRRKSIPLNGVEAKECASNLNQSRSNRNTNDVRGMDSESPSFEMARDNENISMVDSQYFAMRSTSDLTKVSIESEVNLNYKMLVKPDTSMIGAHTRQNSDIMEKSDDAIACKLNKSWKGEEPIVTCTETFSSGIPQKDSLSPKFPKSKQPKFSPEAAKLKVSCDKVIPENSSSDSLSSESAVTDHGSPEKFASETNSLWHMMNKTTR